MKRLVLLLICLVFSTMLSISQVFATFDPTTFAVGGAVNYNISNAGIYSTLSTTKISEESYSTNYTKVSLGMSFKISTYSKIAFGYTKTFIKNPFKIVLPEKEIDLDLNNIRKNSFEVGFILNVSKRVSMIVLTDPINWQTQIGVGIRIL